MANPGYVRSTDGNDADNGSTWALANATLSGAMSDQVAGDRIWVSDNHAESTAGSTTITCPGTTTSPCQILCGDDAAEPPTSLATTGTVSLSATGTITINGSLYCYGLSFSGRFIALARSTTNIQTYENCVFTNDFSSAGNISIGVPSSAEGSITTWVNCTAKITTTGTVLIVVDNGRFYWRGGSIGASSVTPSSGILQNVNRGGNSYIEGVDFSNFGSTVNLIVSGTNESSFTYFINCKLPASWSGSLIGSTPGAASRVEMWNCSAGDVNYAMWIEDFFGTIKHETTLVRTGGASDGSTTISWKMATTANAEYPLMLLYSPPIYVYNTTTGSSKTLTVEILHDSVTALTDAEIWLEVEYQGTSGFPLALFVDDAKSDVIASAADQTSSSETWTTTGMTNPNKQKLSVTFTPQEIGVYICRVCVAKASYTVYVDPLVTVS